ncbi:MAG: hypothetical protein O2894_12895 [Planctomycetota bacterium]|nr:hypothetical protein [Planctomycetota bacterium]
MTDAEARAQLTGFAVDAGDVGYLREAYHGGPYATRVLVPEAFTVREIGYQAAAACGLDVDRTGAVRIPVAMLRARLADTGAVAIARGQRVYGQRLTADSPEVRAFVEFVELTERLEREGREPRVLASY